MPRQPKLPQPIEIVDELPPPDRERGKSIYDPVIIKAAENPGKWVACQLGDRTYSAFKTGVKARTEQLGLVLKTRKRGNLAYVHYEGPKEDVAAMIERTRKESRAKYGE